MNCGVQRRDSISRTRFRAARAALALSMFLVRVFLAPQAAQAQGYSEAVLYIFQGTANHDGSNPAAPLIRDSAGNLYGTTYYGGVGNGTVFKLDPSGTETILYTFPGGKRGAHPSGGLVRDGAGNFYGVTFAGGTAGGGTVFKLSKAGRESVLHSFTGTGGDGIKPMGSLIRDSAGNLYGTTSQGDAGTCQYGTVFKLDPSSKETVLYCFAGVQGDGRNPSAGLVRDSVGNLYGTTYSGGTQGEGFGTVFKIDPSGKETVLHNFPATASDGENPAAALIRDSAGNLYGTTYAGGGGFGSDGTVFKVDPSGTETVLLSFGTSGGGSRPLGGLIRDSAGNLYGTTSGHTQSDGGTAFELAPGGSVTVLHAFTPLTGDGSSPQAGLVPDSAGNLYGTTYLGGEWGKGTVFELTP
jgi:uncharacterized repeat protein (TIGR03803 family)